MANEQGERQYYGKINKLKDLEEKQRILKERILLIGENLIEVKEKNNGRFLEIKKDIEEIPKKVLKKVEIIPVDHMDEVLKEALVLEKGEELFAPADEFEPYRIKPVQEELTPPAPEVTAH